MTLDDSTSRGHEDESAPLALLVVRASTVESIRLPSRGAVVIGRGRECDVRIADRSVSRQHARLHVSPLLRLEDLGSANGTRVGARAVALSPGSELVPGEAFTLGDVTLFVQRARASAGTARTQVRTDGYFDARLAAECARAKKYGLRLAVLVLSASGEGASGAFDETVRAALQPTDVVRVDPRGEAHVLVLHAGREAAEAVAARIGERLPAPLRCDAGVAVCPDDAVEPGALFEAARARLRPLATAPIEGAPAPLAMAPAMRAVLTRLTRLAATDLPLLLLGEPGTGKQTLASWLRAQSKRVRGPFVRVRCGAVSEAQLEAELFGVAVGAATEERPGALENADRGTLLVEHIDLLPPSFEARLVHALEYAQAYRVGSVARHPARVRFIATAARRPAGSDLLRRIAPAVVEVPPLRARPADIEPLARELAAAAGSLDFAEGTIDALRAHAWPGNVRELRATVERAAALAQGGRIQLADLELPAPVAATSVLKDELGSLERERIAAALAASGGNRSRAARALGIARNTLLARLKAYGLAGGPTDER